MRLPSGRQYQFILLPRRVHGSVPFSKTPLTPDVVQSFSFLTPNQEKRVSPHDVHMAVTLAWPVLQSLTRVALGLKWKNPDF